MSKKNLTVAKSLKNKKPSIDDGNLQISGAFTTLSESFFNDRDCLELKRLYLHSVKLNSPRLLNSK